MSDNVKQTIRALKQTAVDNIKSVAFRQAGEYPEGLIELSGSILLDTPGVIDHFIVDDTYVWYVLASECVEGQQPNVIVNGEQAHGWRSPFKDDTVGILQALHDYFFRERLWDCLDPCAITSWAGHWLGLDPEEVDVKVYPAILDLIDQLRGSDAESDLTNQAACALEAKFNLDCEGAT